MTSRSMSPRRRHILSSINPDIAPVRPRPPRPRSKSPSRAAQLNETSSFTHGAAAEAGAAVEPSEPPRHFTDAGDANTSPRQEREHEHQHGGRRHRRRRSAGEDEAGRDRDGGGEDEQQHRTKKPSRFRFKSKSSKSSGSGSRRHHSSRSYHDRDKDRGLEEDRGEQDGLEPRLGRVDDKREVRREPANAHDDDRDRDADDHDGESASSSRRDRHHHRRHHDDDNNNNNGDNNDGGSSRPRRHHHRHKRRRHHHKSDRRTRSLTPPNPHDPPPLDPEAAFRESLFDAMADDEGAAYWEAVYGQPIHVYGGGGGSGGGNTQGELEQMNDDEYAAHVRQKMWEKTHEGLLEERARREERRRQKAQKREGAAELTREMERSLRRGEERRRRRAWQDKWERYVEGWDKWNNSSSKNNSDGNHAGTGGGGLDVEGIPWPVESGRQADIEASAVREFFATAIDPQDVGEAEYLARLKNERVRWHPDKIQQRLGGKVDEGVMRNVTAVFQVVDKLWSDARSAPKSG